jgi:pyruvate,orthophosphate dikinase
MASQSIGTGAPTSPRAKQGAKRARSTQSTPRTDSAAAHPQRVYAFGDGRAEGHAGMRDILGGKGANLAEMSRLGLPVPPGFTISTEVCTWFYAHGRRLPSGLERDVLDALAAVERSMGRRFGDPANPLLVSVRSGARASMPGMMDTVLNLGLNDATVAGLAQQSGNERFAWDAYRRFVQMYGDVVLGIKAHDAAERDPFRSRLDALKARRKVRDDSGLSTADLRGLVQEYKELVRQRTRREFPDDPRAQLFGAISAVFESWNNDRAIAYRAMNDIPSSWGTAVSVCAMVFGNLGEDSGTGVAFTRDPATGEKRFYGEYLMNAQGEDVVAGIRTPHPIESLARRSPAAWKELQKIQALLERHFRDMQDLEFTIEKKKLYMLQCRNGKRTGFAAVRIAVDLVREKVISAEEALLRVDPEALNQLLQPVFAPGEIEKARKAGRVLARGLNAGPGAASGRVVFSAAEAEARAAQNQRTVLARLETSPEDIRGMQAAVGILTARGGMTSHAALVGRQMGKVCVVGAGEIEIDAKKKRLVARGRTLTEGDWISLDGTTGDVIEGELATAPSEVMEVLGRRGSARANGRTGAKDGRGGATWRAFEQMMRWADEARRMRVRANADQPDQCRTAVMLGAEGVGLCRTEHMFFGGSKIDCVREMILSDTPADRERALAKLLPLQRADFEGIFEEMAGLPVTIRSLDPPLHEFLPHDPRDVRELAARMGVSAKRVGAKVISLAEQNPMLGHRGCRLGISYPEITAMQARAIFEAACRARTKTKKPVQLEIMIPLVATLRELELQADVVRATAERVFEEQGLRIPYLVGTMIELPRAALTAGEIARAAEFFSFGTNDLTQTTFGISRDDARFIPSYVEREIFERDPFVSIDEVGVGGLMRTATTAGRATRPGMKIGICGEHGGDPRSIAFCESIELDYVSCSPMRIPIARLAAAQAALRAKKK